MLINLKTGFSYVLVKKTIFPLVSGGMLIILFMLSAETSAATVYSGWVNIIQIRVAQNGNFTVTTDAVVDSACTNNGKFFSVKSGEHLVDESGEQGMLSVALSAYATNSLIQTYVDTVTVYCYAKLIELKKQ